MPEQTDQPQSMFVRTTDFESLYANNVQYQPFDWDLKVTFGELDVRDGRLVVEQHTAITVSWLQAKLMLYFLTLQIGIHEMSTQEKIKIPEGAFPPEPTPPTGDLANDPMALRVFEYIRDKRAEFLRG